MTVNTIQSNVQVVQQEIVKSKLPSLQYDDDQGKLTVALNALRTNILPENAKKINEDCIKLLESNYKDMLSQSDKESAQSVASFVATVAVSILCPPASIVAIPVGLVKGIWAAYEAQTAGAKSYWLQVEIDAEKAFVAKHPTQLANDEMRKEFVYNYIADHSPGFVYYAGDGESSIDEWRAHRHVFTEVQKKYNDVASKMSLPRSVSTVGCYEYTG